MKYLSVCSGIEAATVAWHPLGWSPIAFAEVEAFPSAVLRHHYSDVPNYGDITRFNDWPDATVDVLVGGTPCQSFSVAGLRAGLDDPRGSLMLVYLAIARRYRPRWLVWENVPGVLSADDGRAFGSLLGGLAELRYGFAHRVLDAQYFGLAQRRARVFVVGHLGDWRRAAAVLFERESLSGHPAPRQEAGQAVAGAIGAGSKRSGGRVGRREAAANHLIPSTGDISHCLNAGGMGRIDYETETLIAHALRADGFDASEDGTGRGTPLVPIAIRTAQTSSNGHGFSDETAYTLDGAQGQCIAFKSGCHGALPMAAHGMHVRRLTPRECERLQGFPDDYTLIPYRGKLAADGPRYKALGNSMAVPVMRWIGERIQLLEGILAEPDGAPS